MTSVWTPREAGAAKVIYTTSPTMGGPPSEAHYPSPYIGSTYTSSADCIVDALARFTIRGGTEV